MKTIDLLTALSMKGEEHYKPQYQTGHLNYEAVGLAIAEVTNSRRDMLHVAYAVLEDHNYHSTCAVLDFIAPTLHPMSDDSPAQEYLQTLQAVAATLNSRGALRVFTTWNDEKGEYNVETWKLTVTLEKVEE